MVLIRTSYYNERLSDLDGFWGFFPRTYLPQTKLYRNLPQGESEWAKMTLFFIDSRQEIKVGVGLNFPVCPLAKSEI